MIQIPRKLLPDTITVYPPDHGAGYGGEYLDGRQIGHVRFESADALSITDYQLSEGASGRIWVDAVNSDGAFEVERGSKVTLGGEALYVVSVATYKAGRRIHHWELDVK